MKSIIQKTRFIRREDTRFYSTHFYHHVEYKSHDNGHADATLIQGRESECVGVGGQAIVWEPLEFLIEYVWNRVLGDEKARPGPDRSLCVHVTCIITAAGGRRLIDESNANLSLNSFVQNNYSLGPLPPIYPPAPPLFACTNRSHTAVPYTYCAVNWWLLVFFYEKSSSNWKWQ